MPESEVESALNSLKDCIPRYIRNEPLSTLWTKGEPLSTANEALSTV